jgi:hypothetical protein
LCEHSGDSEVNMKITGILLLTASVAFGAAAQGAMRMPHERPAAAPVDAGQSAFGAIREIVTMLENDPNTDWSKVDIEALRQHLIDMDNVTLHARVTYVPVANGEHIHVAGDGAVRDSIQRMVMMHAAMAGDTADWHMSASPAPDGAHVDVTAKSPLGLQKIRALGLIGMMAEGDHHPVHHMTLAHGGM